MEQFEPHWTDCLRLSTRAYYALKNSKIKSIPQLDAMPDRQLILLKNIGKLTVREIREELARYRAKHPIYSSDDIEPTAEDWVCAV